MRVMRFVETGRRAVHSERMLFEDTQAGIEYDLAPDSSVVTTFSFSGRAKAHRQRVLVRDERTDVVSDVTIAMARQLIGN